MLRVMKVLVAGLLVLSFTSSAFATWSVRPWRTQDEVYVKEKGAQDYEKVKGKRVIEKCDRVKIPKCSVAVFSWNKKDKRIVHAQSEDDVILHLTNDATSDFDVAFTLEQGKYFMRRLSTFRVGGFAGYYSPRFGNINEDLEEINEDLGTDLELKSGIAFGGGVEYNLSPNLGVRGEYLGFNPKTSDRIFEHYEDVIEPWGYDYWTESLDFDIGANLGAFIISGIYRLSPCSSFSPYIGVGIGSFSSEGKVEVRYRLEGEINGLVDDERETNSETVSSTGFQALVGTDYQISDNFSLIGEARYISCEADFEDLGTSIDWSGILINLFIILMI